MEYDDDPLPRSWGWAVPGGGRAGHVEAGARFAGTTSQVCGLFPFATATGSDVRGVLDRRLRSIGPVRPDNDRQHARSGHHQVRPEDGSQNDASTFRNRRPVTSSTAMRTN